MGHIDPTAYTFNPADSTSSVGGRAQLAAAEPVHLQIFLDHSALEVWSGFCSLRGRPDILCLISLDCQICINCRLKGVFDRVPDSSFCTATGSAQALCIQRRCSWAAARRCARACTGALPQTRQRVLALRSSPTAAQCKSLARRRTRCAPSGVLRPGCDLHLFNDLGHVFRLECGVLVAWGTDSLH